MCKKEAVGARVGREVEEELSRISKGGYGHISLCMSTLPRKATVAQIECCFGKMLWRGGGLCVCVQALGGRSEGKSASVPLGTSPLTPLTVEAGRGEGAKRGQTSKGGRGGGIANVSGLLF